MNARGLTTSNRNAMRRAASLSALALPLLLAGCSLFPTTRKLPVPKAPSIEQSIAPEDLVARLNKSWEGLNTLNAKVEFHASKYKTKEGAATDYPTVDGHIWMRKADMLRVLGQLTFVRVFDMASQGKCFSLSIPHYNEVIKGCGPAKKKSANTWENLRPDFFFDAMMVRGVDPNDHYSRTSETYMVEDAAKKHLFSVPEYILHITRSKPGVQQELTVRDVHFHRDDLLPYQQDIYDDEGNLETQVYYADYHDFEGVSYPSTITIKRPIEEIEIVLSVEDLHENLPIADETFELKVPDGAKVVNQE
jgi:hypothetical protein